MARYMEYMSEASPQEQRKGYIDNCQALARKVTWAGGLGLRHRVLSGWPCSDASGSGLELGSPLPQRLLCGSHLPLAVGAAVAGLDQLPEGLQHPQNVHSLPRWLAAIVLAFQAGCNADCPRAVPGMVRCYSNMKKFQEAHSVGCRAEGVHPERWESHDGGSAVQLALEASSTLAHNARVVAVSSAWKPRCESKSEQVRARSRATDPDGPRCPLIWGWVGLDWGLACGCVDLPAGEDQRSCKGSSCRVVCVCLRFTSALTWAPSGSGDPHVKTGHRHGRPLHGRVGKLPPAIDSQASRTHAHSRWRMGCCLDLGCFR